MKVALRWREVWDGVDPRATEEWEALIAAIQTGWQTEHRTDGTHQGWSGTLTAGGYVLTFVNGLLTDVS